MRERPGRRDRSLVDLQVKVSVQEPGGGWRLGIKAQQLHVLVKTDQHCARKLHTDCEGGKTLSQGARCARMPSEPLS